MARILGGGTASESDLSARSPSHRPPGAGKHAAEERYLAEVRDRLEQHPQRQPPGITAAQTLEGRPEAGDLRNHVVNETGHQDGAEHGDSRAPVPSQEAGSGGLRLRGGASVGAGGRRSPDFGCRSTSHLTNECRRPACDPGASPSSPPPSRRPCPCDACVAPRAAPCGPSSWPLAGRARRPRSRPRRPPPIAA